MAYNETWMIHDLMSAVKVKYLDGNVFSQDNAGNLIGVRLTRGGVDYDGGGTVAANVIRADGVTVAVPGTLYAPYASVVLPQAAYAVPGALSIVIKLTVDGAVTTIGAMVANVYLSSTDAVVDPGTIIPSISTLIAEIETAVASVPADYSSLWASLAPAFSTSTAYTAGQYVTYNGGLYRFVTDHAAGSWSSSDVSSAKLGNDIADLKSAIDDVNNATGDVLWFGENWTGTYHSLKVVKENKNTFTLSGTHTGSTDYRVLSYDTNLNGVAYESLDVTKFTIKLVPGVRYKIVWEMLSGTVMSDSGTVFVLFKNKNGTVTNQDVSVYLKDFSSATKIEKEFTADATDYGIVLYERNVAYSGTYRVYIIKSLINDEATDQNADNTLSAKKIYELSASDRALTEKLENDIIENADALIYSSRRKSITKTSASSTIYRVFEPYVDVKAGDTVTMAIVDSCDLLTENLIGKVRFAFSGSGQSTVYKEYDAYARKTTYTIPSGYTSMQIAYEIDGTNTEPVTANFGRVYVYTSKPILNEDLIKIESVEAIKQEVAEISDQAGTAFPIEYNDRFFVNGRYIDCINPYKDTGIMKLKGQLHCHKTNNQGEQLSTLTQIYNNYAPLYDFMNLTDYNAYADLDDFTDLEELNAAQSTYNLIQLTKGYELKVNKGGTLTRNYHLIVLNANSILTVPTGTMPYDAIKYLVAHGCIVDFAHPTYSELNDDDAKEIKRDCRFIEVCNGGTSMSETQWDAMLTQGNIVWGIGVSDCHGTSASAIESAYVMVFASEKTRDAIMEALLSGNFYATNGAAISSVSVTASGYTVTCEESATIDFIGADGDVLQTSTGTTATYQFTGAESYVRAKVTLDGEYAWTQPVIMAKQIIRV